MKRITAVVPILIFSGFALLVVNQKWLAPPGRWVDDRVVDFCNWYESSVGRTLPDFQHTFTTKGTIGVLLASLICGLVSSMVVSNRMAFFSDALAHCAFAGVGIGWILRAVQYVHGDDGIISVMIVFGMLVGAAVAYVRENSTLANDTVIGVFFAGAMGFGAVLQRGINRTAEGYQFSMDTFLWGSPKDVVGRDLIALVALLGATLTLFVWLYNRLVFTSFNPSLARARNFPVRMGSYLFIVLLALIVNLCIQLVGALLINALLILPAATASHLSRSLRQFFWYSVILSLASGLGGWLLSATWELQIGVERPISLGAGGLMALLGVTAFAAAMTVGRLVRGRRAVPRIGF